MAGGLGGPAGLVSNVCCVSLVADLDLQELSSRFSSRPCLA